MMRYTLDERLRAFATPRQWQTLEALAAHGSERRAAKVLGCNQSLVGRAKKAVEKKAVQQGYAPAYGLTHEVPDGLRLRGTSILYDANGEVQGYWNKTALAGRPDDEAAHIPDPKNITKISTLYDQQGNVTQQWISEKPEALKQEQLAAAIAEGLKADLPVLKRAFRPSGKRAEHLLNMVPMGDPHFGLLCWDKEVGSDFDLTIAKTDLCGAVDYLVSQAPPAERCIIANMGDFYHVDNLEGLTPANKNSLDVDSRLPKIIEVGVVAMKQAVATGLTRHQTVELVFCRANHDPVLGLALQIMMAHLYQDEPRVIVHSQPTFRHYIRHGKVLLGFVHGDKTKNADLPGIMATERPEEWGATKHRYFFRGHHHHDEQEEFNGCKVEQVRTLAAGDAYAVGHGYLSGRDMKLITYHSEYGENARITCGIDLLRSLQ